MEDHKRKNKKKNQNKRPTADQIKKLQKTVEQKEVINGSSEEKSNGTTSATSHENHKPEQTVEIHEAGEANGNKKNKKKNKSQKVKDVPQALNGLGGKQIEHDYKNSNGIHEVEIEKADDYQTVTKHSIDAETVAAALETLKNGNESQPCSKQSNGATSGCHQYHGDEAPTCSHHIRHHMNNISMGDFKVDFDVQKHLSPIGSPVSSNKEYFYKGFNVDQIEVVDTEPNLESEKCNLQEKMVDKPSVNSTSELNQSLENTLPLFDSKTLLKNVFGSEQQQLPPFQPDMMKSMFLSKEGKAFNSQEMMKGMFGGTENNTNAPFNPTDVFGSMLGVEGGTAKTGINSTDLLKNMFASLQNEVPENTSGETKEPLVRQNEIPVFNAQDMLKSMLGSENRNRNSPMNPNDLLRNMFEKGGDNSNPAAIFEAMLGEKTDVNNVAPDPDDIPIPDMFSQMSAMAQQMDPNIMSSMGQIAAHMDPALLMGVNNMVSSMLQGQGLDLQKLMQMKANHIQQSQAEAVRPDMIPQQQKSETKNECVSLNVSNTKDVSECDEKTKCEEYTKTEDKILEQTNSIEKAIKNEEYTAPGMKCNFSFSSYTSEPTDESTSEAQSTEVQLGDYTDEKNGEPRLVLRFVRDESIPELLEKITKTDTKKEVTTDRIEIKTSKFKTIINKVLKKEKKSVDGNVVSSIEVHEQRVEFQNKKGPSKSTKRDVDFEKLQHVKEPLEIREKKEDAKTKEVIQKQSSGQNKNMDKIEKKSGESKKEDLEFIGSTEQMIIDHNVEFNLESMNEIFTNLLQGRKMNQEATTSSPENIGANNESVGLTPASSSSFETIMKQNMSNLFNNLMEQHAQNNEELRAPESNAGTSVPNQNPGDLFQNLQQALMKQFATINPSDGGGPSQENLFESMTNMFDKMMSTNERNSIPNFHEFFSNQENMSEMLKMSEMLFGNSQPDQPIESVEGAENTDEQKHYSDMNARIEPKENEEEKNEEVTIVHTTKNVHQNDRPSVLLKQLLGDKFWRIRKKENVSKETSTQSKEKKNLKSQLKISPDTDKSKTQETFDTKPSKSDKCDIPSTSTETLSMPAELQLELEKESPLVRMLHKRIQKDTKLQQFLKDKLKKDPKMQKFIQERLQKDERIQKFMREKLSNDKALRQNFEEKFKNELGLTNIVPKFDDDEDTNAEPSSANNDEEKKSEDNFQDKNLETDARKDKKDNLKSTAKKIHTGLLFKTYAELTCLLIAVVYTAILCY